MNDDDLYCSQGPVSSMPGSRHSCPPGSKCDQHHETDAVARLQGETDSMGCEYYFACKDCIDELAAFNKAERETPRYCEYCKAEKLGVSPMRDYDEGMSGPLYDVCTDCRQAVNARLREEYDENCR